MNLFAGFVAIVAAMNNEIGKAAWCIVLAALFDTLDGLMARLTHSASEFGVELDSLCDVVSFGVAPSVMLYVTYFHRLEGAGIVLASLPSIAGALRLARFNVQLVGFDKNSFRGLPIPASALFLVSFLSFYYIHQMPGADPWLYDLTLIIITIGASLLMVSTIKYDTIPKISRKGIAEHPILFAFVVAGATLAVVTKGVSIFPTFFIYLVFGAARQLIVILRAHKHKDDEEDAMKEAFDV